MNTILTYLNDHYQQYLEQLNTLLRIPSVSTNPLRKSDVNACAVAVNDLFVDMGFSSSIIQTKGHPIVFASYDVDPSKKTVLIYGHYDVQPEDPVELWESPPFEPTIRDGYVYARGASDNKGQFMAHVSAVDAILKTTGTLPCNVIFLIEGEEEIGSENLFSFLKETPIHADICLVSDTPMYAKGFPSLCFSLRGLLYLEVHVKGPVRDLHSGQHGGVVKNPIHACAELLSKLKDDSDNVTIPGFYDDVRHLTDEERRLVANLPINDDAYKTSLNISDLVGDSRFSSNERKWFRPTLDCNGIYGGYTGEGAKTVIPSSASMKISMRLVSNQNPQKIKESFVTFCHEHCPKGVTLEIHDHSSAPAFMCDPTSAGVQAGLRALEETFHASPSLQGEGGSIPIISEIQHYITKDVVLMGLNFPDDQIHSPNERFYLENFKKGIEASIRFLHYI